MRRFVFVCLLGGCSFSGDSPINEVNSCSIDSECTSKHCQAGRCVVKNATGLNITLEVLPKRMPDGSQPFAMVTDSFTLGSKPRFDLHLPKQIPVHIVEGGKPIDAQVTFRPKLDSGFIAKPTQISTARTPGATTGTAEIVASLLSDITYDVVVQPVDLTKPPYSLTFSVDEGGSALELDYASITWRERMFNLRTLPDGMFTLRARAKSTGQIISNTMMVSSSSVILRFPPDAGPYEVELSPAGKAQLPMSVYSGCDDPVSLLPTLTVDVSQLDTEAKTDAVIPVELPVLPKPISYTGTISLCANPGSATLPDTLPVTLKTSAVSFANSSKLVHGSFETATVASYDESTKQYSFCSWILPGEYVVKITPPANTKCEIFAEKRQLRPDENGELGAAELALRTPATLGAKIETPDGMPMANASVDFVALGIPGVTLSEDDPSVPIYNRSRQGTSGTDGKFNVSVDVGTYDVIIKPPAQSDFAWQVLYDVEVASRRPVSSVVTLNTPTLLSGMLHYANGMLSDQRTLGSAEVHAFTVVDEDTKNARSVEIARSQADPDGNVMLLVSSKLQRTWNALAP